MTGEAVSREQLTLAVLDFIDTTSTFHEQTHAEASKAGRPVPAVVKEELAASRTAVNECLALLGGLAHFYTEGGVTHPCKLEIWDGYHLEEKCHIWRWQGLPAEMGLHLNVAAIDEMRVTVCERLPS